MTQSAVVNGMIYFGSDRNVYALNATTSVKLWSYTTGDVVGSSPAVANGVVYAGSSDGNLYALNATTGAKLWSYTTGGSVLSSPAVANGVVYVGSMDGNLYALSATTGAKLWSYNNQGSSVNTSPAVANGVVYFTGYANVHALNATTGALLWTYDLFQNGVSNSSPAVANGVIYFGSDNGTVYALNASTGAEVWIYYMGSVATTPAVANGVVYIGSDDYNVYALNATTGAKLWSYQTGSFVESSPAVANGVVYVGSEDGNLYALNSTTGAKLWSYGIGANDASYWGPAIVDGVVYVPGANDFYAFSVGADLFLRVQPSTTTVHQGDLLTYAFPVWNLGPDKADLEVLNTQVPAGTVFDYVRISGTPGVGTCTTPRYLGTGQIVCHENAAMASNTTWTVRLTVKVTAPAGTVITENAAKMADTPDPNMTNNTATVSFTVQ